MEYRAGLTEDDEPATVSAPIPAGETAPHWEATCLTPTQGEAVGRYVDDSRTYALGSASTASFEEWRGLYTGTARAAVHQIAEGSTGLGTISSLLQVQQRVGAEPVITYRVSVGELSGHGGQTAFTDGGFTVAGTGVPARGLVEQFTSQVAGNVAKIAAVLGPFGLRLLAPSVGPSAEDPGRVRVIAPVIAGHAGLTPREGTIGQEQGVRFAVTTFEGTPIGPGMPVEDR